VGEAVAPREALALAEELEPFAVVDVLPKGAVGWVMNRRLLAPSCDRLDVFNIRRQA
jgi:hypothetical protein